MVNGARQCGIRETSAWASFKITSSLHSQPDLEFLASRRRDALGSGSGPANGVMTGLYVRGYGNRKTFPVTPPPIRVGGGRWCMAARGSRQLVVVRLAGRSALIERFLQSVTDAICESVATTDYLDFQVIEFLAIDYDSGVLLVAGALHLGSGLCTSLFDTFNDGFGIAPRDRSRSGLCQRGNGKGNECHPVPPTAVRCGRGRTSMSALRSGR